MGTPEKSIVVVPEGVVKSRRYKEILENTVSPEALRRREGRRNKIASIKRAEMASRQGEALQLKTFELALGIPTIKNWNNRILLSDEQKNVVKTAILESGQNDTDQKNIRETLMGSLQDQEVFVANYETWKEKWDSDPVLQEKQTFEEYSRERGLEYIKQYAKEIRVVRGEDFFTKNRDLTGMSDDQIKKEKDKFTKALDIYFQANGVALAGLNSLDEKEYGVKREQLLQKFSVIMVENGFDKTDKAKIEELFNLFVGDFEYEYAAYEEYEATYEEMLFMASLGLTREEWEKRRKDARNKKATGELQEYLQQQTGTVYTGSYESAQPMYSTMREVENSCNVHFVPSGAPDTYRIKAPAVTDNAFSPLMQIVYDPPDERTIANARFVIQQPWQDEDAKISGGVEVRVLNGVPTMAYKPEETVRGVNIAILDHVMNKKINIAMPENAKQGTNRIIREELMVHFAERLLTPFAIGDRAIREDEVNTFQRFMEVVLRDDSAEEYNSLQERIKKAWAMVDRDDYLPYLQQIFSKPGGTVRTLSKLDEEIRLRQGISSKNEKSANT